MVLLGGAFGCLAGCGAAHGPVSVPAIARTARDATLPGAGTSAGAVPVSAQVALAGHPVAGLRAAPPAALPQSVAAPGTRLRVSVLRVLAALPEAGAVVPRGERAIGVIAAVADLGPGPYDGSAPVDFALRSSAGPGLPVYVARGACQTPLIGFEHLIEPGSVGLGCVAFAVPRHAGLESLSFAPGGGPGRVTWALPPGRSGQLQIAQRPVAQRQTGTATTTRIGPQTRSQPRATGSSRSAGPPG